MYIELSAKKNEPYRLKFPMVDKDAPEAYKSGETVVDDAYYDDGAGDNALAITDTSTEIGATGVYALNLIAAEMNHDTITIILSSPNGAKTTIVIKTTTLLISDLPTAILAAIVEGGLSVKDVLRVSLAALAGKTTGGGTTAPAFRDQADGKNRILAEVNSQGDRTSVTLDGSD